MLVRVAAMAMYFPAWLQTFDEVRFARIEPTGIFDDQWMPAGYSLWARTLREIVPALWASVAIQHLIGLAIGISLFWAMRRLGAKPWLACVPAAVVFLSGDQIWIEHQIMSEPFVTALIAIGLAFAIGGLTPRIDPRLLGIGSALLMAAALSRNIALATIPVLTVCTAFWAQVTLSTRLKAVAATLVPALAVLAVYVTAFELGNGRYLGISDMSGWNLYARIAPFADCDDFTPPPGTRRLCEAIPSSERVGSLGYQWDPHTRGRLSFPLEPATSGTVGAFAREAILHQPLDYLLAVTTDAARYIDPGIGPGRPFSGEPRDVQSFGLDDPTTRGFIEEQMALGYTGTEVRVHGRGVLATYQELFRVSGLALAAFVVFTLIGMVVARGPIRLGVFLFGLTALALYLVPVAVLSYEVRYGLPPQPFIVTSGALGLAALLARGRSFAPFERLSSSGGREPGAAAP